MGITKINMNMMFIVLVILAVIFSFSVGMVAADQSQIYVNPAGNDSWDGQYATWNGTSGPKLTVKNATSVVGANGKIYIANGMYNENGISITKNMSIIGESKQNTIINGTNTGRIFSISNTGLTVFFANLTLANGNATGYGGAIASDNTYGTPNKITIKNCIFKDNRASTNGGAIQFSGQFSNPPNLTVSDSTFINNRANQGGAISNSGSSSTITNSDFISNSAVQRGGVIYNNYGSFTVQFSRFIGNTATNGAVIWSDYGGNAPYNWWGSNNGPSAGSITGSVLNGPWLVLTAPTGITVAPGSSPIIMGDLQHDSDGFYNDPAYGHVPDGIPVTFVGDLLGSVNPLSGTTLNGLLITNFIAASTGVSHPTFTVDGVTATGNINIASITPTNLVVGPVSGSYNDWIDLTATLTDDTSAPIIDEIIDFYVNGSLIGSAITDASGIATYTYFITQGTGIYLILAQFLGNDVTLYSGSTGTNDLTVNPISTNLVVNGPVGTKYRDVVNLTATITDSFGIPLYDQMVYFNVNGNFAGAAITNWAGIATISYTLAQGAGIYQLLATFLADTVYAGNTATNSFTLTPSTTSLTVDPKTSYYNNTNLVLTANLTDTTNNIRVSGKTISFYVNNVFVNTATTDVNGVATLSYIPLLSQGIYSIFANFDGTTGYIGSNGTNTLTITPAPTAFWPATSTISTYYNKTVNLTSRLHSNFNYLNGKAVSFTVNGETFNTVTNTIGNVGTATIPYTANLTPGTYQVIIQFAGDGMYNATNVTYNLVVSYNPTKLNVTAKSGVYTGKVNLTATLKDTTNSNIVGKTVYFYVNNSSSPVGSGITDAFGVATYEYTIAQGAGVYPISAQFLAEGGYNASTNSSTLTVGPAQSYLSINPASGYNGDNVTLTASLWDINAVGITSKWIDFYVNNVFQGSNQTDINGIATWIYKITQSAGVYPGFIKAFYAVDAYYAENTGFNTLTVIPDTTAPTVSASPAGKSYNAAQNVVLTSNELATIYYTTDGSTPTTSSPQYTIPIFIGVSTVLKFFAVDSAGNPSNIYAETYVIDTLKPTVSANPKGGLYKTNKVITLSMNEPGTIYYTTNGFTPTTSSAKYTGPITISSTTTLKFFAVDSAGNPSLVYTEKYTIDKTAPKVTATTPKNGATGVSRGNTIVIKFNENIKASTYWSKIYVKNLKTGRLVSFSKWISGNTLYIKNTYKRYVYTWYRVYIPGGAVKDYAGNNGISYSFTFKTGRY